MKYYFDGGEVFDNDTGNLSLLDGTIYYGLDGADDGSGGIRFPGGIHMLGDHSALIYGDGSQSAGVNAPGGADKSSNMMLIVAAVAAYFLFLKRR